jgi:hypothetical protein
MNEAFANSDLLAETNKVHSLTSVSLSRKRLNLGQLQL